MTPRSCPFGNCAIFGEYRNDVITGSSLTFLSVLVVRHYSLPETVTRSILSRAFHVISVIALFRYKPKWRHNRKQFWFFASFGLATFFPVRNRHQIDSIACRSCHFGYCAISGKYRNDVITGSSSLFTSFSVVRHYCVPEAVTRSILWRADLVISVIALFR